MSDILEFLENASTTQKAKDIDSVFFRSMSGYLPKNSGIQNVWTKTQVSQSLAKNMHWKFAKQAIALVKAREYGIASISSENGNALKSMNTQRFEQHTTGKNLSDQKVSDWDRVFYGNEKFQNNGE
ncbi:hypothetical protein AAA799E16_01399 [Marine Group I thaumarchaeote SCGC AAA799-E16]|uniref:Uncharacterized protein n=2 Tax=Marine Group I TaxID=905826 RepID=A0A087RXV3_9ARCH|nr:hypothetical protein AAA799E16_01399 [Marine Group I thaumarchaeote SCGC AAA799-E16]KFM18307.1 hypothetical protein SCCGRSA3_01226 [Marine Group I thaumarchaeote SCGC RSA3]